MPELPEVETVCRALRPHLVEKRIKAVSASGLSLRKPIRLNQFRQIAVGRRILAVRRRAKFLVIELEQRQAILLHLGMSGAIRICPAAEPLPKHAHLVFRLSDNLEMRFIDPRRFGLAECCRLPVAGGWPKPLEKLGPEPLDDVFSPDYLFRLSRNRSGAVKTFLMNQNHVAGVGNIYASEACFRAGVKPARPAGRITRREAGRLVEGIKSVLQDAILCGGTTISDFMTVDGTAGSFHVALEVYGRTGEPCTRCGERSRIRHLILNGRSTFFCPRCQK